MSFLTLWDQDDGCDMSQAGKCDSKYYKGNPYDLPREPGIGIDSKDLKEVKSN